MLRSLILGSTVLLLVTATIDSPATAAPSPRPQALLADAAFTETVVGSVPAPVAVAGLPDGRAVVLEKAGRARVVRGGALLATPALTLTVCSSSERGLLGLAPDPNFGANGFVYVYYTRPTGPSTCVNRVSRFTMSGDTIVRSSERVLLDNIGSPAGNHNGGDVAIGNDGFLYVSVGDGGCDPRGNSGCAGANDAAQDQSLLNGKILRVDRITGAPAPGNPLFGAGTASCRVRGNTAATPTSKCQELFAWGLRNPWRFAFDPNTGATRFVVNDVGQGTREEVDRGARGANYGWPIREGVCAQGLNSPCAAPAVGSGLVQPITDYSHSIGTYVTGGAFVPNGAWGAQYDGGYLFADGGGGQIFFRNSAGTVNYGAPFASGAFGISDMDFVMDGGSWALYYVNPSTGEIRRIRPNVAPAAPTVALTYAPIPLTRVYDSRSRGADSGAIRGGTSRLVRVVNTVGAHRAALLNVSALRPTSSAFITFWQPRTARPNVWSVVGSVAQVTAGTVVVPIDANGNVLLYTNATTNLTIDVVGFYDVAPGGVAQAGRLVPVNPSRLVDTRMAATASNSYTRAAGAGETVLNVPVGATHGVTPGASAVAVVVTAIAAPTSPYGFVVVHPHGTAPGMAQVFTNGPNDVRANLVVVPLGPDGSIDLRLRGGVANVWVDVMGSFTGAGAPASASGTFVAIAPSRVADSRLGVGFARLAAGGTGTVNPASVPNNASAVVQTATLTRTGGPGLVRLFPTGVAVPGTSNVFATAAGQTRAAGALTRLGGGAETAQVSVAGDVVLDVTGYFNP